MNILITGANGYLGKEMVQYILENTQHKVIGVSRRWDSDTPSHLRFKKRTCDLLSPTSMGQISQVDAIIHLAALVKINTDNRQEVQNLLNYNMMLVYNVLNWAKDNQVKKFILASSMTVYKNNPPKGRLQHTTPLDPSHFYGLSKLWGEQILRLFCANKDIQSGLVVRFPGLFGGSRKNGMLYNTAKKFKNNEDITLDLKNLGNWDVMNVQDAVHTLVKLLNKPALDGKFSVLNAGYGDRMDLNALLKQMQTYYQSKSKVTVLNQQDYCPCAMDVAALKKHLKPWNLSRARGLKRLLEELH